METLPNIKYCCNKTSNSSHCSSPAKYKVLLVSRKNDSEKTMESFRCEDHKNSGTNGKKVSVLTAYNQDENLTKVFTFLRSLIGKKITAKVHTAKELEVLYVKETCGVMCLHPITKKYKFVYYNQITSVSNHSPLITT